MKYILLCLAITAGISHSFAQLTKDQRIQDSVIGWDPKNYYDRNYKPQTSVAGKQKEAYVNKMAEWVKASYTPVAGLGEYQRFVNNDNFGLTLNVWNVGYDYVDVQKHFRPIPEELTSFWFTANQVFGANPIYFMNKSGESFFTMQPNGYTPNSTEEKKRIGMNKAVDPNTANYSIWVNGLVTVYVAPDNKIPMIPVSKGELLTKAEAALDGVLADKKKDLADSYRGDEKSQDYFYSYFKKEVDQYRDNINALKEKYKNRLDEPASLVDMQPTFRSFTSGSWDAFTAGPNTVYYPVYKFDAATLAKMKEPKPLWLAVSVPFENKSDGNQLYEMYTSMMHHINYEYIYNYFFAPDKVQGKAYSPANETELKDRLSAYKSASNKSETIAAKKQTLLPANVVLFDDFSQDQVGGKPGAWFFRSIGKPCVITAVDDEKGNWLKLGYNNVVTSTTLKTLPENFSLEYDMLTSDFADNWGARIQMNLYGNKKGSDGVQYASSVETNITAGKQSALDAGHNYRGEARISLVNSPSKMDYNNIGGYFAQQQSYLTDTKRKVHVQLVKKGDNLSMFLNGKEFANSSTFKSKYGKDCGDCNIPAGVQYTKWEIQSLTNDADHVDCYIGNIKVIKL